MHSTTGGVLRGIRIVEIAGVGPVPFAAMLLADMGAQVLTVDRMEPSGLGVKKEPKFDPTTRSRSSIALDLKNDQGRSVVLRLVEQADALIEGFRPGVMERLGLGPSDCAQHNQRLVFGRATGWGQDGPLSQTVGHDLNYLAITGALAMMGPRKGVPSVPLNLIGDYAGGGVYLAMGVLAALLEAKVSGEGQVVDAAMVDGIESMLTHYYGYLASNRLTMERESNYFDGGAPWYGVYKTSDQKFIAVGAVEPQFYSALVRGLGIDEKELAPRGERERWPQTRKRFEEIFESRTRAQWVEAFDGIDACVTPRSAATAVTLQPASSRSSTLRRNSGG